MNDENQISDNREIILQLSIKMINVYYQLRNNETISKILENDKLYGIRLFLDSYIPIGINNGGFVTADIEDFAVKDESNLMNFSDMIEKMFDVSISSDISVIVSVSHDVYNKIKEEDINE